MLIPIAATPTVSSMKNDHKKNILVCPLNWGKGHLTRVQVIAYELKKSGHKVYFAAPAKLHSSIDKSVYDKLLHIWSPGIFYSGVLPLSIDILIQLPVLLFAFLADRLTIPRLVRAYDIDIVISDNRFGARSGKKYSVYITHQLRIALPRAIRFMEPLVSQLHRFVAGRYDECWIPDYPGKNNLSGSLSHNCKHPPNTHYIGPLTRLSSDPPLKGVRGMSFFTLALLSGPEPQRSKFERIIISRRHIFPGKLIIVAGKPGDSVKKDKDIQRYSWLDGPELKSLLESAGLVICRSGYSTIMDINLLGCPVIMVPTPGQPEQEYLASHMAGRYGISIIEQKELARLSELPAIKKDIEWPGMIDRPLDKVLDELIKRSP